MSGKKILVAYGVSINSVLNEFAGQLSDAFNKIGHKSTVIDLTRNLEGFADQINEADYICLMNGVYINEIQTSPLAKQYENIRKKFFSFYVDAPFYQISRIKHYADHIYNGYIDKKHIFIAKKYYPDIHNQFFMPPAGIETEKQNKQDRILFIGNYNENYINEFEESMESAGKKLESVLRESVSRILNTDKLISGFEILQEVMKEYFGIEDMMVLHNDEEESGLSQLCIIVDQYIRNHRRKSCLEYLLSSNLPVDVIGNPKNNIFHNIGSNIRIIPSLDYKKSIKELAKYKIILNVMPFFTEGAQERIFNAMLNKTVCITDITKYLQEEFTDGKEIIFYQWNNLRKISEVCEKILSDEELYDGITDAAYKKCDQKHRWGNRAEEIIRILQ